MSSRTKEVQRRYYLKNRTSIFKRTCAYQKNLPKEVRSEYRRKWRLKNPDADYFTSIKIKYGIDKATCIALFKKQNGKCAICRKPETSRFLNNIRRLSIDHNHINGKIRGLLCFDCNTAIGKFKENTYILYLAQRYLLGLL